MRARRRKQANRPNQEEQRKVQIRTSKEVTFHQEEQRNVQKQDQQGSYISFVISSAFPELT